MADDTSNMRVTRYAKYAIESRGIEIDGRWVPEYRILKDGQTAVNWRLAEVNGLPSANAAIDVGIELAIEDINTMLLESDH